MALTRHSLLYENINPKKNVQYRAQFTSIHSIHQNVQQEKATNSENYFPSLKTWRLIEKERVVSPKQESFE